jgi:hypothetical protein
VPLQQALPAWVVLNASNDTAASGMADQYTSFPYNAGGLNLGDYFDLTSQEAFRNCKPATGILYFGRYRRIQVDSGATAANVKTGTIGLMASQAAASLDVGNIGGKLPVSANIVTSFDKAIGNSTVLRPVVFLNAITPGNFGWVQELGVATVLGKTTLQNTTPLIGDTIITSASANNGTVDDPTQSTTLTYALYGNILGIAYDIPGNNALFRVLLDSSSICQD